MTVLEVQPGTVFYPPNAEGIQSARVLLVAMNQAYQLPDMIVPEGMVLNVKAWPLNGAGNLVYIGYGQALAVNINSSWPLIANEAIQYQILNANVLWAAGSVNNLFVCLTCERRKTNG